METEMGIESLVQHLAAWFDQNPKTQINERYKANAITLGGEWILINVQSINVNYAGYFKPQLFQKNADLLAKKLVEVVKEWMKMNEVQVYHLKFKIIRQGAEFPRQGLLRV